MYSFSCFVFSLFLFSYQIREIQYQVLFEAILLCFVNWVTALHLFTEPDRVLQKEEKMQLHLI